MKNVLKLGLVVMAVAALAACGGGSSDVADTYVGTWKSKCFSYTGNDGNTYFQTRKINIGKVAAAELAASYSEATAFANTTCTQTLGAINNPASLKINIGAEETFLGAPAHYSVFTITATGEARQGYLKADSTQLLLVFSDASGQKPGGWSAASPYTKQ